MITKEEFIQALKNIAYTNEEFVERYIWFGTPAIFADCEQKYYNLKGEISTQFPVKSKSNIIVVGSAKLGFSIAPRKRFRDIQDDSDIDVAIIDEDLFDSYWERLFEFNINIKSRSERDEELYQKFLQYFFKGWLRPDLFPFNFRERENGLIFLVEFLIKSMIREKQLVQYIRMNIFSGNTMRKM